MHTLIACWHKVAPSDKPAVTPVLIPREISVPKLKSWGISTDGMDDAQIHAAYWAKLNQLREMDAQFADGEEAAEGVGLIRVGRGMEDRVGSWPSWLYEILNRRLGYDSVNRQFFFKNPDEKKILRMNDWLHRLKNSPLREFAIRFPMTLLRNLFHLGALSLTLKNDTQYFEISAVDQPEKGEDGYYQFRDNSFWERDADE